MAESDCIKKMAEIISDDIFTVFGWEKVGPVDNNWECSLPKEHSPSKHEKYTHPSDVVFTYKDPYTDKDVYLLFDLKSYGNRNINKSKTETPLTRLNDSVACANISKSFSDLYITSDSWVVHGILFIYNHDGNYDRDFDEVKSKLTVKPHSSDYELSVIGPTDISYIYDLTKDLQLHMFKRGNVEGEVKFISPHLELTKRIGARDGCAILDDLISPWLMACLPKTKKSKEDEIIIYYRDESQSVEDFMYLIDSVLKYQLLNETPIQVKCCREDNASTVNFDKAKKRYASEYHGMTDDSLKAFKKKIDLFSCSNIPNISTHFSEIEIGMRGRGKGGNLNG